MSTRVQLYVVPMDVDDLRAGLSDLAHVPSPWKLPDEGLASVDNVEPMGAIRHLYRYVYELGSMKSL